MDGIVLAEQGHVINILPPIDITGGKTCQAFNMKNAEHATIFVQIGVSAAAFTKIIVSYGTATAAVGSTIAGATAMPFSIYKQETAGADQDVLGARTAVLAAGYTPSANDNIMYVIEIDSSELADGSPYVQLSFTNGSNSVIASAIVILSGIRFAGATQATATT